VLKTKRSGNIACGLFLAVLGLAATWASLDIDEGAGGNLHPRTFPLLIGVCLFLGGAALALTSRLSEKGGDKTIDWPDRRGWKLWTIALASLVAYVGLSGPLGFLACSFCFVMGFIRYFGRYSWRVSVGWAGGMALFVYFVFIKLLDMTMPMGPFSFLA
jgi:putative tricarboxylic transport membrane protein